MNLYKRLLRPLFFKLDPETAHNIVKAFLRHPGFGRLLGREALFAKDERLRVKIGGLNIYNPVGLAAGFDKDCEMVGSLERFGFGYIVVGSVLYHSRPGNPRPRMLRYPEQKAIVSCMGLPSKGLDYVLMRLRQRRRGNVPLFVNCNGFNLQEYVKLLDVLQPFADGLEISLSCANCANAGGDFLDPRSAETLFKEIANRKIKPIFIKIPGYVSEKDRRMRFDLIERALKYPIDGFTTATAGPRIEDKRLSTGSGGLSGHPLFPEMLRIVQDIYELTQGRCHIKARGGVFSPEEAFEAIAVGASTVEIFSSFIYEGWCVARNLNQGLLNLLDKYHIENVTSLRGAKTKRPVLRNCLIK